MMAALDAIFARQGPGPLILITESLGSKIMFDALNAMLERKEPATARSAASRLVQVFMVANPLPIVGLADQVAGDQQTVRLFATGRCASAFPVAAPIVRAAGREAVFRTDRGRAG